MYDYGYDIRWDILKFPELERAVVDLIEVMIDRKIDILKFEFDSSGDEYCISTSNYAFFDIEELNY